MKLPVRGIDGVDRFCGTGCARAKSTTQLVSDEANHPSRGHVIGRFFACVVILIDPSLCPLIAKLFHEWRGTDRVATTEDLAEVRQHGFAPFGHSAAKGGEE